MTHTVFPPHFHQIPPQVNTVKWVEENELWYSLLMPNIVVFPTLHVYQNALLEFDEHFVLKRCHKLIIFRSAWQNRQIKWKQHNRSYRHKLLKGGIFTRFMCFCGNGLFLDVSCSWRVLFGYFLFWILLWCMDSPYTRSLQIFTLIEWSMLAV